MKGLCIHGMSIFTCPDPGCKRALEIIAQNPELDHEDFTKLIEQLRAENYDLKIWNNQQRELIIDLRQRLDKIKKLLEGK